MHLELSQIRLAETEFSRVFEAVDLAGGGGEDYRVTAPVALRMVIHRDQERFRLVGTVNAALELVCSRCLEPFALTVDRAFNLRYHPSTAAHEPVDADAEVEVEDDDVALTFYRDDRIDLLELLQEQFYLALPMKPLCGPVCQGICPQCGTNRNLTPCTCSSHWEDPRLAGLKTLITERKSDDA